MMLLVGAGVPFGCIVTADDGITTGVSPSSALWFFFLGFLPFGVRLYVHYVHRGSPSIHGPCMP